MNAIAAARIERLFCLCSQMRIHEGGAWGGHGGPPLQKFPHCSSVPSRFVGVALRGHPMIGRSLEVKDQQKTVLAVFGAFRRETVETRNCRHEY